MIQRQNGRQLIIIGIVIVVVVILLGLFLGSRGGGGSTSTQQQAQQTKNVVVALTTIPQGTTFKAGQPLDQFFGVRAFPVTAVPFGAYSSVQQIANVVKSASCYPATTPGCSGTITTTQPISQGLPVVSGMFSTLGAYRQTTGPSFSIPLGYVGIAINLTDVNSVLGSINPGDTVDLIASYIPSENAKLSGVTSPPVPPQTQYVLNDLKVIGVNGPPAVAS